MGWLVGRDSSVLFVFVWFGWLVGLLDIGFGWFVGWSVGFLVPRDPIDFCKDFEI